MSDTPDSLSARLERLEALEEIRQLPGKYALAADMCDFDALADLYVEDVEAAKGVVGREALRHFFAETLPTFETTIHLFGNHVIDLDGADKAHGNVYFLVQQEMSGKWVTAQGMYHDLYERPRDRWLFRARTPLFAYAEELGMAPGSEGKVHWPGRPPLDASMYAYSPAWSKVHSPDAAPAGDDRAEQVGFLGRIRAGTRLPRMQIPRG